MKKVLRALGVVLGIYLIVRAAMEPFLVDVDDPGTYRLDWGGPSLIGVLLVHCGPGIVAAAWLAAAVTAESWLPRTKTYGTFSAPMLLT